MNHFSTILTAALLTTSLQSFATQLKVTENLRGNASYYVRYDEISAEAAKQVGVPQIPGTWDDEGDCRISGNSSGNFPGYQRADLEAGDVLVLVGQRQELRRTFSHNENKVIQVVDVKSEMRRESDQTLFLIGCNISQGKPTHEYKPVTDVTTKAYLTVLGLMVK